jgi:hypothetical protein
MPCDQSIEPPPARPRWIYVALFVGLVIIGVLSVKRITNGNGDLNGNYRLWRANLAEPTQPGRHMSVDSGWQDVDSYPPITYAMFANVARLELPALAVLWYAMNVACTVYLWRSLSVLLEDAAIPRFAVSQVPSDSPWNQQAEAKPIATRQIARFLTNARISHLAALAVLPSWLGSVLIGQHALLQMTLVVAAFRTDVRTLVGSVKAGTFLVLATAMKVLPVVFLLSFLSRRRFRVLAAFVLMGCCLVFGLGSLFFGAEKNWEFHVRWLKFAIRSSENRPPDPREPGTVRGSLRDKNQAIESVLARLFMDLPIHTRHTDAPRVNLLSVAPSTWRIMSSSLLLISLSIGTVAVFRCEYKGKELSSSSTDEGIRNRTNTDAISRMCSPLGQLAILSPMQLFISPVIWSHYFLWLYLPLAYLLVEAKHGRLGGIFIYCLWVLLIPALAEEHCRAVGPQLWMTLVIYVWICSPAIRSLFTRQSSSLSKAKPR